LGIIAYCKYIKYHKLTLNNVSILNSNSKHFTGHIILRAFALLGFSYCCKYFFCTFKVQSSSVITNSSGPDDFFVIILLINVIKWLFGTENFVCNYRVFVLATFVMTVFHYPRFVRETFGSWETNVGAQPKIQFSMHKKTHSFFLEGSR